MRVAVEEMEGVTSADVSLEDGEVRVALEDDNRLRLDRLRQVIRDQGFTPRQAEIEARGLIDRAEGGLLFRTPDGSVVLEVSAESALQADLEGRVGEEVLLRGRVEEPAWGRVHVTSVESVSSLTSVVPAPGSTGRRTRREPPTRPSMPHR